MILNYIWIAFFLIAFVIALAKTVYVYVYDGVLIGIFKEIMTAAFDAASASVTISIGLIGLMTLWLGLMKIGEEAGAIRLLTRIIGPFFHRLFPEIPKGHPVMGSILMNYSANMLGLDNAATPLGLKAMQGLQELNPQKETASNAQIMFLVLNTAGLTLLPVNVMLYRAQAGSLDPASIFIPLIIATFVGTLVGLISVSIYQRINLFNPVLLAWILGTSLFIGTLAYTFSSMSPEKADSISSLAANSIILFIITVFIAGGWYKKLQVFEVFIEGAKEGFHVAIKIIPYLVAILVGVAVFRASGAMDYFIQGLAWVFVQAGMNTDFVPALPTGFMKSFSGSGARGLMIDTIQPVEKGGYGPDSFVGKLVSIFQGSSDTTFYIIAVYFGSVGIRKTRYALTCGLIADAACLIAGVVIAYLFFK